MPATAKSYDALVTSSGPGDLWLKVGVPSAGGRLVIDSLTGTPETTANPGCVHLGMTREGCTIAFNAEVLDSLADELASPYASKITNETAAITGDWLQVLDMDLVDVLTLGSTLVSAAGIEQVTFGGKSAPDYWSCAHIWETKTTGKWAVAQFYRAFNEGGWGSQVSRRQGDGVSTLNIRGLSEGSRAVGDQVGTVWRQI